MTEEGKNMAEQRHSRGGRRGGGHRRRKVDFIAANHIEYID